MQEGVAKREIQAHVAAWIVGHLPEARNGLLDSCAAFSQERQMRPQRHACRGERHANAGIAAPRKGPVEGHAQIVDVGLVRSEPLGGRPRLQLGLGTFKELSIELGVASREVVEFGAPDELLTHIGACRLEQAIMHNRAADIGAHE